MISELLRAQFTLKRKRRDYDSKWLSYYKGFKKWSFYVGPSSYFDDRFLIHLSGIFGSVYLHLPIYSGIDDCESARYGFYFYGHSGWWPDTFVWCWGYRTFHFALPWHLVHQRTSLLLNDNTWATETKKENLQFYNEEKWPNAFRESHPYIYILQNGTVQNRVATIIVKQMEWRRKWSQWLKYGALIRTYIDINFDDEVGEETGSWKGGTIGCSETMLPGESAIQTLRRMEKTRQFKK